MAIINGYEQQDLTKAWTYIQPKEQRSTNRKIEANSDSAVGSASFERNSPAVGASTVLVDQLFDAQYLKSRPMEKSTRTLSRLSRA